MSNAELEALSNTALVWYPTFDVARDVFLYFLTLSQNVLIFVSNTSQLIGLVHFIINEWSYLLLEEIDIESSVAFLKCSGIFILV